MSRTKLLLDVVSDMRSLADSLETMANAVAGNDGISKEKQADKPNVTHEMLRELAVKLSRNGKREEIKQLMVLIRSEEVPLSCPHGRPILIKLTKRELENKFKRNE